ncbi:MAG: tetratricopeptide repeat protein [Gallionella sp.]
MKYWAIAIGHLLDYSNSVLCKQSVEAIRKEYSFSACRIESELMLKRALSGFVAFSMIVFAVTTVYAEQTEWETLNWKVMSLFRKGQYAEAVEVAKRAIIVAEQSAGPDNPDVATSVNNLAMLYDNLDNFAEAEPLYKRALAIKEKALGARHISVATILINLALLYDAQEKYLQAEPLYQRALAIQEETMGAGHPEIAATVENLAALYRKTGRQVDAEIQEKRLASMRSTK